jgi:hypothetical protein
MQYGAKMWPPMWAGCAPEGAMMCSVALPLATIYAMALRSRAGAAALA